MIDEYILDYQPYYWMRDSLTLAIQGDRGEPVLCIKLGKLKENRQVIQKKN